MNVSIGDALRIMEAFCSLEQGERARVMEYCAKTTESLRNLEEINKKLPVIGVPLNKGGNQQT